MTFSFHPEAESEFREAIDYYENCEPGLGYDFSIEILSTIQNKEMSSETEVRSLRSRSTDHSYLP